MRRFLASFIGLAALAQCAPLISSQGSCKDYSLTINITSENYKWTYGPLNNNEDVAAYLTETARRDAKDVFNPIAPPDGPESATYTISGTFCQPQDGGDGTVLIATHGGGFDRYYWASGIQPEKYSFADYAVGQGYSIFYYDRVGLGKSDPLSGYKAQTSIHVAVLTELAKIVRSDKFGAPASKVVLVGHSMGSAYSNLVLHSNPELIDAAILTGAAYPGDAGPFNLGESPRLANLQRPEQWGKMDGGWTAWGDKYAGIEAFFKAPAYDPAVVDWVEEHMQPTSVLEKYIVRTSNFSSPDFTGPVMLISGQYDALVCEGNCEGIIDNAVADVFPASKNRVAVIHPGAGHGINFALNATGAYGVITDFLKTNNI